MGSRLDAGTAFTGAVITPFYDSLLVKVSAHGLRFVDAARRMERCLQEFRVRGVKTNIPFLINLVQHETFLSGNCTTRFLDESPELFDLPERKDRATRVLTYIGEVLVNGHHEAAVRNLSPEKRKAIARAAIPVPAHDNTIPEGTKQVFDRTGPAGVVSWINYQKKLLLTDTTFRDAHQS